MVNRNKCPDKLSLIIILLVPGVWVVGSELCWQIIFFVIDDSSIYIYNMYSSIWQNELKSLVALSVNVIYIPYFAKHFCLVYAKVY